MIAIPGTTKAKRLEENWASRDIDLTEEEKREMRKVIDAAKPHGNRYAPAQQALVGHWSRMLVEAKQYMDVENHF